MTILLVWPSAYAPLEEKVQYNPRTKGEGTKAAAAVNDGRRRGRVAGVESLEPEAEKAAASGDTLGVPRVDCAVIDTASPPLGEPV